MSNHFHRVAKFRWAESIQQEIKGQISNDFNMPFGRDITFEDFDDQPAL
jgi:hypothetical protein